MNYIAFIRKLFKKSLKYYVDTTFVNVIFWYESKSLFNPVPILMT